MNFNEYQQQARKTAIYPQQGNLGGLIYATLGLAGEAGELANKVKKILRDGAHPDDLGLKDELGDVLWYVAQVATELDADLDWVVTNNILKLENRKTAGTLKGSGDER